MSDTLPRTAPAQRPTLSADQAVAALGEFGTAPATPRPAPRAPARPQPAVAGAEAELTPRDALDTGQEPTQGGEQDGDHQGQEGEPGTEQQPVELAGDTVLWQDPDGSAVTLEEARKRGLRQDDYSRKMNLLAEGRNSLTSAMSELHADREAVASMLLGALPKLDPQSVAGMTGEQVFQLQQQSAQMLDTVRQLRARSAQEKQRLDEHELQTAFRLLPEVIPEWSDPQVAERQRALVHRYIRDQGLPEHTVDRIKRDPWLLKMAILAASHTPVVAGAQRGGQARAAQVRQGQVNPSAPASPQAPMQTGQQRDRTATRELARGGNTYRQRFRNGVRLLGG